MIPPHWNQTCGQHCSKNDTAVKLVLILLRSSSSETIGSLWSSLWDWSKQTWNVYEHHRGQDRILFEWNKKKNMHRIEKSRSEKNSKWTLYTQGYSSKSITVGLFDSRKSYQFSFTGNPILPRFILSMNVCLQCMEMVELISSYKKILKSYQ